MKKQPRKNYNVPPQKPEDNPVPGKDLGNTVSGVLGKAAKFAVGLKPRKASVTFFRTYLIWVCDVSFIQFSSPICDRNKPKNCMKKQRLLSLW